MNQSLASSWNLRNLLICHGIILLMIGSFCFAPTHQCWDWLNVTVFKCLNHSLEGRPLWQLFWALANHKLADWVADLFFLGFFTASVLATPREFRWRQVARFLFCILYAACIIFVFNELLFRKYLKIAHPSPTVVVPDSIRLSHEITWLKVKDSAKQSFPGDHGTTAILFAVSYMFFSGRRLGLWGCLYAIFLCLPRMVTGAHWFSDIVIGSGSIVLFTLGWAFCTPFSHYVIFYLEKALSHLFSRPSRIKT